MQTVQKTPENNPFRIGEWLCDPRLFRISGRGRTSQVEPKMMQVLVCLARNPGEVVARRELLDTVWGDVAVSEQVLSRAVSELRKIFEDDSRTPRVIETIAGSGYRLIQTVEPVTGNRPVAEASRPLAEGPSGPRASRRAAWMLPLGLVIVAGLAWAVASQLRRTAEPPPATVLRASVLLPADAPPELSFFRSLALSPDGSTMVYTANLQGRRRLYLRRMDRAEVLPVAGSDGGHGPFFSPDSLQLGFYADGKLRRVPVAGGDPVTLYGDASDAMGATWRADGGLVFVRRMLEGLWWIPAAESARQLTALRTEEKERSHFWPHFLPGGEHLLFTVWRGGGIEGCSIELLELSTGQRRPIVEQGADARYHPSGRLLFTRAGQLMEMPFDAARLEPTGPAVPVLETLLTHPFTGAGHFDVAADGTLVFVSRDAFAAGRSLFWIGTDGRQETAGLGRGLYTTPRLSPDGRRLAATVLDLGLQIWLYDLERGGSERLTRDGQNMWPLWAPDGRRMVFASTRGGSWNLYLRELDGAVEARRLTRSDHVQFPGSWSPDGRTLTYSEFHPDSRWDVFMLDVSEGGEPRPFLQTPFDEFRPTFSPGGELIAYVSNETGRWDEQGRWEVFLRPLADPGTRLQVSTDGGGDPLWSGDGRTIYYRQGERLLAVAVELEPTLSVGDPQVVVEDLRLPERPEQIPTYDISPDGRFLATRMGEPPEPTALGILVRRFPPQGSR